MPRVKITPVDDDKIVEIWAETNGNAGKIQERLFPAYKVSSVSQHISRSKDFINKLHKAGFLTKSEKADEEYNQMINKRKHSEEITPNVKTEIPLVKRQKVPNNSFCQLYQSNESSSGEESNFEEEDESIEEDDDHSNGESIRTQTPPHFIHQVPRTLSNLQLQMGHSFRPVVIQSEDSPLFITMRKPLQIKFSMNKSERMLAIQLTWTSPTIDDLNQIANQIKGFAFSDALQKQFAENPDPPIDFEFSIKIPTAFEVSKISKFETDNFIGVWIPKETNFIDIQ